MVPSVKRKKGEILSKTPAFDKVKGQIAYCGLWCGSCAYGNGTINDLAGRLERLIKDYGIEGWGPKEIDYKALHKSLISIKKSAPCPGCLNGGGKEDCEIRACAKEKRLRECVECTVGEDCENSKFLNHMRVGASRVGMVVKRGKGDRTGFLARGNARLRSTSPCQILFTE